MAAGPVPFGKYELIARIAAGGMAEIFLARAKSIQGFEKYLVIKRILRNRTTDPEFLRMFLDEARVAATLDHPNIVQIYDVGHVNDDYFIAMEYLRGHNIIEIVRAGAKLGYSKPPLEHVISIMTSACAGLHYAHDKRDFQGRPLEIVHRDVTPQNVVISFEGVTKIVDFGIAKAATREVETLAGTLKGKIGYMSPEQCRGIAVDRRSDVFALGIILYELTTGKRLYHERSDFETLKRIIEGPVPAPRDILPFYPAALNAIVVRCLQKSPEDRYASARELHSELDAFARDNQLVTGSVPLAQYMERVFADEIAQMQSPEGAGMLLASQASNASSSPSYLGEASPRSNDLDVQPQGAGRQQLRARSLQAAAAVALVVLGGAFVWWRTRPVAEAPRPAATSIGVPPAAVAAPGIAPAPAASQAPASAIPAPGVATSPASAIGPAHPKPVPKPGDAHITVASDPRCEVLVDGSPYGQTPVIDLAIPAGRHTLILLNSSAGIKESVRMTLSTGQLWTRSFQYENGKMVATSKLSAKMLGSREERDGAPSSRPKPAEGAAQPGASHIAAPPPAPRAPSEAPATRPASGEPAGPTVRTVAGFVLDAQKMNAPQPHLPDFVSSANPGKKLIGTYKICVNRDGKVYDVSTVSSISGADAAIIGTLKTWTYKPQTGNVCGSKILSYQVP